MRTARSGSVLEVTLGRPEKLNALDSAEWRDLLGALRAAEDDTSLRVIVLRAEGRAFCAGNDIAVTQDFGTKAAARSYFLDLMIPALAALATSRLPVVAEVRGAALGGGLELLQYCDVVVASESATFGLPETGIGLWATIHLATSAHLGDRRVAQFMALTGERLTAAQAMQAQIVSEVCPEAAIRARVDDLALRIAHSAPRATAFSKAYANAALTGPALGAARRALDDLIEHTLFEAEAVEGIAAFSARRQPKFAADFDLPPDHHVPSQPTSRSDARASTREIGNPG